MERGNAWCAHYQCFTEVRWCRADGELLVQHGQARSSIHESSVWHHCMTLLVIIVPVFSLAELGLVRLVLQMVV